MLYLLIAWFSEIALEDLCDVMGKMLDCDLEVSEFKLHLNYHFHVRTYKMGKGMIPLSLSYVLNSITCFFQRERL